MKQICKMKDDKLWKEGRMVVHIKKLNLQKICKNNLRCRKSAEKNNYEQFYGKKLQIFSKIGILPKTSLIHNKIKTLSFFISQSN